MFRTKWAAYPANYHTVPTDDDVFNYRDFTKIPLYMQNATLYDIRKNGVDPDFKTTLQDRLEKYVTLFSPLLSPFLVLIL